MSEQACEWNERSEWFERMNVASDPVARSKTRFCLHVERHFKNDVDFVVSVFLVD